MIGALILCTCSLLLGKSSIHLMDKSLESSVGEGKCGLRDALGSKRNPQNKVESKSNFGRISLWVFQRLTGSDRRLTLDVHSYERQVKIASKLGLWVCNWDIWGSKTRDVFCSNSFPIF